jgi:hypothetical protein
MHAITVRDASDGLAGMSLTDMPRPHAAERVDAICGPQRCARLAAIT